MTTEWDSEKLAKLIEERKPIYDLNLKEHCNKQLIDQLWVEVADGMQSTVVDCKSKWTSMRNSYARYLRDVKNAAYGGTKKRKWYLADSMTFLNDFMGQTKKSPNNWDTIEDDTMGKFHEEVNEKEARHYYVEMLDNHTLQSRPRSYSTCSSRLNRMESDINESPIDVLQSEADILFFRSLFADMNRLTERRKRKFKEMMMSSLHTLIDYQEEESSRRESL